MYDFQKNSFCWGSWILKKGSPSYMAIESALLVYEFGFYGLGFLRAHFDVRKENRKVVAFHQKFGAKIVNQSELDWFFDFSREQYRATRDKYHKYLAES